MANTRTPVKGSASELIAANRARVGFTTELSRFQFQILRLLGMSMAFEC